MGSRRQAVLAMLALAVAGCGGSHKDAESPASEPAPASHQPGAGQPGYGMPPGAAAAPPATAPAPEGLDRQRYAEPPPPETLEQAEADLERARAELEVALGTPPANAADEGKAASASRGPAAKKAARPTAPSCPSACKSLASLERAAAAVCRLAGDPSARCSHARALVDDSTRRLSSCGCSEARD